MLALALLVAPVAEARRYEVNVRVDHRPGACTLDDCTLREAVIAANARQGRDTIVLPAAWTLRARRGGAPVRTGRRNGDLDITSGPLEDGAPREGEGDDQRQSRRDRVFDIGAAGPLASRSW